jgi:hypothetical protein
MTDLVKGVSRNMKPVSLNCIGDPAITHAGQAHFAGGYPSRCGLCAFHELPNDKARKKVCKKAAEFGARKLTPVPADAVACKYFEAKAEARK